MGQAAEDLYDMEYKESMPYGEWNPRGYKTPDMFVWTTRDGQKIKLVDMETSHIANCIRMLEGTILDVGYEMDRFTGGYTAQVLQDQNEKTEETISRFKNELARRGQTHG